MYHCPMHPEVHQDHPGSCPKCGMQLVQGDAPQNLSKSYRPLIVIIAILIVVTCVLTIRDSFILYERIFYHIRWI
jgi:hypothetical protein